MGSRKVAAITLIDLHFGGLSHGWASLDEEVTFTLLKCEKYARSRCTLKWPLADVNFVSLHEYMTCFILFNYESARKKQEPVF